MYEFWTDRGEPVRLHDTDLVSVTRGSGPCPEVTVRFVYEPGWVPAELTGRPVVEFVFGEVVVHQWSTWAPDPGATGSGREVDLFDWDGHRTFALRAGTIALDFSAGTLHVRTVATS